MSADSAALWLSIIATLVAAFAAFVGYALYRTQADPEVIVYVEADQQRAMILNLVVENIGGSAARNVVFRPSVPLPQKVFHFDPGPDFQAEPMTEGPLVRGIPLLPPGGTRRLTWGLYGGLRKVLGDCDISVTVEYSGRHFGLPWPLRLKNSCVVEVYSFEATDASDRNFPKQIADHLKGVGKTLQKIERDLSSG